MRRASVIGPLILIVIGVLFLLRNLRPELPVINFVTMFWPFILVAWGVLRLLELFYWFSKNQPMPMNGISGGEWFLVVLFSIGGSALHIAQNRADWLSNVHFNVNGIDLFDDGFQYPISHPAVKAEHAKRLVIENFRGDAQITGADTNEIRVTGKKKVRSSTQSDADKMDQQSPVELIVQGDVATLRCNQEHAREGTTRISDSLEVVIPRGFAVEATGRRGDFFVRDVNGAVEIRSDNAGVHLDNLGGPVKVYTRKGDIIKAKDLKDTLDLSGSGEDIELDGVAGQVTINGSYSGKTQMRSLAKPVHIEGQRLDFRAEAIPGEVTSSLSDFSGSGVTGPIRISSKHSSRDVRLSGFTQALDIELSNGNVTLDPATNVAPSHMDVKTHHGDIEVALPAKGFHLHAATNGGSVSTDDWGEMPVSGDHRKTVDFSTGSVGPDLVLSTDRGNLTIRKAESGLAAAAPKLLPAPQQPPEAPKPPGLRVE